MRFLQNLANFGQLKDNLLLQILALRPNIDISKKENVFDNVKPYYKDEIFVQRSEEVEIEDKYFESTSEWENKDFRIRKVTISNVRAFPKSQIPFGIDFTQGDDILSFVIMGNNGVGKSSIFNALEYAYTKRIGEAELRTSQVLDDEASYFKTYLQHYNNDFKECELSIYTNEGSIFTLNTTNIPPGLRQILNPGNHFISEFDVVSNCRLDFESSSIDSFNFLIAKNVGLSPLLELDNQLFEFVKYNRSIEANNVKKTKSQLDETRARINSYSAQKATKENLLSSAKKALAEGSTEQSTSSLEWIHEVKKRDFSVQLEHEELMPTISEYKELVASVRALKSKIDNISEVTFLEQGLRLLKEGTDCPFCKNSKSDRSLIEQNVKERIRDYHSYISLNSNLQINSSKILEYIVSLYNTLIKLRNEAERELNQTTQTFISDKYNESISGIRNTLFDLTSYDLFAFLERRGTNDISSLKDDALVGFLLEMGEGFIYRILPGRIGDLKYLSNQRIEAIREFETKMNRDKNLTDNIRKEAILRSEISELEGQLKKLDADMEVRLREYETAIEEQNLYLKVKADASQLYKVAHKEVTQEIGMVFEPLKGILLDVLNDYIQKSTHEGVELLLENEEEAYDDSGNVLSTRIVAFVVEKGSNLKISVKKYFNTFHYKLFCTMVAVSIAIASRRKTKVNLPLVLDDLFYSSDFENRATIEKFITKLFDLFAKYTPDLPLQLIMFTHDRLIFDSCIHSLNHALDNKLAFAKLFHHSEARVGQSFKDMVTVIPKILPTKLFSKEVPHVT